LHFSMPQNSTLDDSSYVFDWRLPIEGGRAVR
jgi:hypothetical protein